MFWIYIGIRDQLIICKWSSSLHIVVGKAKVISLNTLQGKGVPPITSTNGVKINFSILSRILILIIIIKILHHQILHSHGAPLFMDGKVAAVPPVSLVCSVFLVLVILCCSRASWKKCCFSFMCLLGLVQLVSLLNYNDRKLSVKNIYNKPIDT